MRTAYLKIAPLSLAMAMAFPVAVLAPAAPAYAEDARRCVIVEGRWLVNTCSYQVEVAWCTEGNDCRGRFANQQTLNGYARYSHLGGDNASVLYGACRGANTIRYHSYSDYEYSCD